MKIIPSWAACAIILCVPGLNLNFGVSSVEISKSTEDSEAFALPTYIPSIKKYTILFLTASLATLSPDRGTNVAFTRILYK